MKSSKITENVLFLVISLVLLYFATSQIFNLLFSFVLGIFGMLFAAFGFAGIEDEIIKKSIKN